MNVSKQLLAAGFSLALLTPGAAFAQGNGDTGLYVGATANWLDADFENADDVSFDDSDTTWGVRVGYMFNEYFGIEGGYIDLGNYEGGSGIEVDADSWQLAAIVNYNFTEQFSLYGKGGLFFVNAKSDQFVPGVGLFQEDDNETEAYLGVGAEFDVVETFSLFAEYSWIDTNVSDLSINMVLVGAKYNFGGAY